MLRMNCFMQVQVFKYADLMCLSLRDTMCLFINRQTLSAAQADHIFMNRRILPKVPLVDTIGCMPIIDKERQLSVLALARPTRSDTEDGGMPSASKLGCKGWASWCASFAACMG